MNVVNTSTQQEKKPGRKSNRLLHEKSPYLLQHAYNPVDWYPWGEEAFDKARREDKPIFLSIGYSTCYWCHVMEREVFEREEFAKLMNEYFVNIKVDREERPDVDRVYMAALQGMAGGGGWPMSIFLTPELKPFFGATYIPPVTQHGRIGFADLAYRIHELWRTQRQKIAESSEQITSVLQQRAVVEAPLPTSEDFLGTGYGQSIRQFDSLYGGFGGAPKFPRPVVLNFLFRYYERTRDRAALDMALTTLRKMAAGGIYDHVGGGFHRYAVDAQWRVPHFEKMLYDQAQLVNSYLDAYQITHDEFYADVARDVLEYVLRRMTDPDGGFYSAEDAESAVDPQNPEQKEEGEFYLWRKSRIEELFRGSTADIVTYFYGVMEDGNAPSDPQGVFTGKNVLFVAHTLEETAEKFGSSTLQIKTILDEAREKLFEVRESRPRPHLDDKILTSWNGLMISAFSRAFQLLEDPRYLIAARKAATFITTRMYDPSTRQLVHRYRDGDARFEAHLGDYAFLVMGLIDLYEASFEIAWLEKALTLTEEQIEIFYDERDGGFWDTSGRDASILMRTKEDYDGAEPTGNSIAVLNLFRLAQVTHNNKWMKIGEKTLKYFGGRLRDIPFALPQMLVAVDFYLSKPKQIVVAGTPDRDDTRQLVRQVHRSFIPNKVLLLLDGDAGQRALASHNDFFKSLTMKDRKATAYVCEDYVCKLPVTEPEELTRQLEDR